MPHDDHESPAVLGGPDGTLSRRSFLAAAAGTTLTLGGAARPSSLRPSSRLPGRSALPRTKPHRGGTLHVGMTGGGTTDTLDPLTVVTYTDNCYGFQLYDMLIELNADDVPKLVLAEEIESNSDATAWTIRLRPDVTFHNGKPLTADDVIYTFQQVINPKQPGDGAVLLSTVDVAGIKKIDKLTCRVPCKSPYSTFLDSLAQQYFTVLPVGFDLSHPVGTGPFKYKSFTAGVQAEFVKNENYWETGLPYLDGVVVTDYTDETSQVDALLSGVEDAISPITAVSLKAVKAAGYSSVVSPSGGFIPFTMRVDQGPLRDKRVRQALAWAINRKQMKELVFGGYGTIANDLYSIWDSPNYDTEIPQREQDLDRAKSLLKQAGESHLSLELVTAPVAQGATEMAEVLAQQVSAAGIHVTIRQLTTGAFYGPSYLSYDFAQDTWNYLPFYPTSAEGFEPGASFNEPHFHNDTFNHLYSQGLGTLDSAKRADIAHDMQQIFWDECPWIIPLYPPVIDAFSPKFHGDIPAKQGNCFNNFNFKEMWLE